MPVPERPSLAAEWRHGHGRRRAAGEAPTGSAAGLSPMILDSVTVMASVIADSDHAGVARPRAGGDSDSDASDSDVISRLRGSPAPGRALQSRDLAIREHRDWPAGRRTAQLA